MIACVGCFPSVRYRRTVVLCLCFFYTAYAAVAGIVINEIMASNGSTIADEDGDYEDWIELYNVGDEPVDLSGWGLTDDEDLPYKWIFPDGVTMEPGGYLLVWASGKDRSSTAPGAALHSNFSIASAAQVIMLISHDGTVIDRLDPVVIPRDISYGRDADGEWCYYEEPTPGFVNSPIGYSGILDPPIFSHEGGFHTNDFDLVLSHPDPDVTIVYTLDGSSPDIGNLQGTVYSYKNQYPEYPDDPFGEFLHKSYQSHVYAEPLRITDRSPQPDKLTQISTTNHSDPNYFPTSPVRKGFVVRAIAHKHGAIVSPPEGHTYFISNDGLPYSIPVVSLQVQENHLFDYHEGIYVAGVGWDDWRNNNPDAPPHGSGQPSNYTRRGINWERPARLEIHAPSSSRPIVNQGIGLRVHGNWSRIFPIKHLRFYARRAYDERNQLQHDLFSRQVTLAVNPENDLYKRMLLRGQGNGRIYYDMVFHRLMQPVYEGIPRVEPAVHFINGEYWGLATIRDQFDEHHLGYHYGLDTDNIIITDWDIIATGFPSDKDLYEDFNNYVITNDMALSHLYAKAETIFCVRSYSDHLIMNIYSGNSHLEYGFWRARVPSDTGFGDGRWRTYTKDYDATLVTNNFMAIRASPPYQVQWGGVELFANLLESDIFRNYFLNRFADHINTTFNPQRFKCIAGKTRSEVENYLPEDYHRSKRFSYTAWQEQNLIDWADQHPARQRNHICEHFGLAGEANLNLDISAPEHGYVRINTVDINPDTPGVGEQPYPWTGVYFQGIPITLTALPNPGHRFAGWVEYPEETSGTLTLTPEGDLTVTALFEATPRLHVLHYWNFNDPQAFLTPTYSIGGATMTAQLEAAAETLSATGQDFSGENSRCGDTAGAHLRLNNPLDASLSLNLPTTGYEDIVLKHETRRSGQGAGIQQVAYTLDGASYIVFTNLVVDDAPPVLKTIDFSSLDGTANNPFFGVRIGFATGGGGEAGNNRFDNLTLEGRAISGVNTPPVFDQPVAVRTLIEHDAATLIDLNEVYHDDDGDLLTFTAISSDAAVAATSVEGGLLSVSPLGRGDAVIRIMASDGNNPPAPGSFRVLVYPSAHPLENTFYSFSEWRTNQPAGDFPAHMLLLQSESDDTTLNTVLDHAYAIPAWDAARAQDADFPYAAESRTRINGLGPDGISFINTGRGRDLGGALLAVDTRNVDQAVIGWLAGTVTPNTRVYALRLQYRVGIAGDFIDVLDEHGWPIEYERNDIPGHVRAMPPVRLPSAALGQEYVQLLWRYHKISGDSGPRAELRLDDVLVSPDDGGPAVRLDWTVDPPSAWQSGKVLPTLSVRAVNEIGLTDLDFSGPVTLSAAGIGMEGDVTVTVLNGTAVFDNVAPTGLGSTTIHAAAAGLTGADSTPMRLTRLTEIFLPRYIQGKQNVLVGNDERLPFAYRARIEGLLPNATYRYGNRVITIGERPPESGAGNQLIVLTDGGDFIRNTDAPRFRADDVNMRHGVFGTDADGAYEGWFITEPTGNNRFWPGRNIGLRLIFNDGMGGESFHHFMDTTGMATVLEFGSAPSQGTGFMGQTATSPPQFVLFYDNLEGSGRPLAATPVEITGAGTDDRYAGFYHHVVAKTANTWGTLIPNDLPDGVRRIEYRCLPEGSLLAWDVYPDGVPGTLNPSGGLDPVKSGFASKIPTLLSGGDTPWTENYAWSVSPYPDGAGDEALINAPLTGDRDVDLFAPVSMGKLTIMNASQAYRNRVRDRNHDNSFTWQSGNGSAELIVGGAGDGFAEFQIEDGTELRDDLTIVVDHIEDASSDYGALRLRESWHGAGGIIKQGPGMVTLTGEGKDYLGATVIEQGVMAFTQPAAVLNTAGVEVQPGGQLRLISGGNDLEARVYHFGGTVTLNSAGRQGVPEGENLGVLGALRYEPGAGTNYAVVTSPIHVAGPSGLHVGGPDNRLDLSGPISGTHALTKSGGGTLVLNGDGSTYTGTLSVATGVLCMDAGMPSVDIVLEQDTILSGAGLVGSVNGAGVVSPGPGQTVLTAFSVQPMDYRFVFSKPLSPVYSQARASGNDVLRITDATPFVAPLSPADAVNVFFDISGFHSNHVFQGGFFTDSTNDFAAMIENAQFNYYIPDQDGDTEHDGNFYSLYAGPLTFTLATELEPATFPEGTITGRVMRIGFAEAGEPFLYDDWSNLNFDSHEQTDEGVSGPLADPDDSGIQNLMRYALGLDRYESFQFTLPAIQVVGGEVWLRHRRLIDQRCDVDYQVQAAEALTNEDGWRTLEPGRELIWRQTIPVGDDLTEVVSYAVVNDGKPALRFFRLRVSMQTNPDYS